MCVWVPDATAQDRDDPRTLVASSWKNLSYLVFTADWFYPESPIANDIQVGFDGTHRTITDRAAGVHVNARWCGQVDAITARCSVEETRGLYVSTGGGNDVLDARAAGAHPGGPNFDLGPGDDLFLGGPGLVAGTGGPGDDLLEIGRGSPAHVVRGGEGDDVIRGGEGPHHFRGEAGNDAILGGPGDDRVDCCGGSAGDDYLVGGDGDDVLAAKKGADIARGGPGDDRLYGTADQGAVDLLDCGPGSGDEVAPGPGDVVVANCEHLLQFVGCSSYPGCVSTVTLVTRTAGTSRKRAGRRIVLARNKLRHYSRSFVSLRIDRVGVRRALRGSGRARLIARIKSRGMGLPATYRWRRHYVLVRQRNAKAVEKHPAVQRLRAVRSAG